MQKAAGGEQHVAFTRILHRTQPDSLMTEVSLQTRSTYTTKRVQYTQKSAPGAALMIAISFYLCYFLLALAIS